MAAWLGWRQTEAMQEEKLPSGWTFHRLPCADADKQEGGDDNCTSNADHPTLPLLRQKFDDDGFICLASVFDAATVDRLKEAATANFDECFRRLHERGHTSFPQYRQRYESSTCSAGKEEKGEGDVSNTNKYEYALKQGIKGGFKEVVMRSPGRFEVPFGCDKSPFSESISENLLQVVRALLSDNNDTSGTKREEEEFYLCNASIVNATPGSSDQGWHADGGHISLQAHEPCHCLNVFIPLVDVTLPLGPTEVRPGSHFLSRNLAPMMLAARCRGTLRQPVIPLLRAGYALIFDYRILHRGRANISYVDRPIFVMTFAKRHFKDRLNFPAKSIFDSPDTSSRV